MIELSKTEFQVVTDPELDDGTFKMISHECIGCGKRWTRRGTAVRVNFCGKCGEGWRKKTKAEAVERRRQEAMAKYAAGYGAKEKEAREEKKKKKMADIEAMGCICPGCLIDFSGCPPEAKNMVFELCHYHGRSCKKRVDAETFLACRDCNRFQRDACGHYEAGKFVASDCYRRLLQDT